MKCACGGDLRVMETREFNNVIYRRRKCISCNARVFTAEQFIPTADGRKAISHYQTVRSVNRGKEKA